MVRVKRGFVARRKRKKVFKRAKGFRGSLKKLYRASKPAVRRAKKYATRDRRNLKRDMRSLWITRIGIAARELGTSYSRLMNALKNKKVSLDRKTLAELAVSDPKAFARVVEVANS
ncbi:MAG: 50S ribosomal protein L20 [Candidatus Margulisbacteria bacterium]|nr:50S ribosomal protein L20 [Candidatus Margulisiibacteriota bacterium]